MKLLNLTLIGLGALALASCGVSDRHDEVKELNKKDKWNEDQTNQAIDIILEGYDEVLKFNEDYFLVEEKIELENRIHQYGDKDVLKERKAEIKEAEKNLKQVQKDVDKAHKLTSDNSSDYYDSDSYESDYETDYE